MRFGAHVRKAAPARAVLRPPCILYFPSAICWPGGSRTSAGEPAVALMSLTQSRDCGGCRATRHTRTHATGCQRRQAEDAHGGAAHVDRDVHRHLGQVIGQDSNVHGRGVDGMACCSTQHTGQDQRSSGSSVGPPSSFCARVCLRVMSSAPITGDISFRGQCIQGVRRPLVQRKYSIRQGTWELSLIDRRRSRLSLDAGTRLSPTAMREDNEGSPAMARQGTPRRARCPRIQASSTWPSLYCWSGSTPPVRPRAARDKRSAKSAPDLLFHKLTHFTHPLTHLDRHATSIRCNPAWACLGSQTRYLLSRNACSSWQGLTYCR